MSKMKHLVPLLLLALAAAGCEDKEAIRKAAEAKAQAFGATQQGWRNERTARLTQPDGWTSLVGLHWLEEGEHYFGSDADNGIRIAEKHQSAIFDVFSRLNNRRHHDGTGLGLAICQRIADLHQGRLSVESQPGEGSRFTLHLPVVGD